MGLLSKNNSPGESHQTELIERVALFGRLQLLHARLLVTRSATRTLEDWCRENNLTDDPTVTVIQQFGTTKPPTAQTLANLQAAPSEIAYRYVSLCSDGQVLATADNWFVPSRLSGYMNAQLKTTTPFGKVIAPLRPFRIVLNTRDLWSVLPEGWHRLTLDELGEWARSQPAPLYRPTTKLFSQETLLIQEKGTPLSIVHEYFAMSLLAAQFKQFR
ncbi:MAG TPA: hypothetical protein VF733_05660 [Candidatus Saccharimonadales bacterium]